MEATRLIDLFDSCWFGMEILKAQRSLTRSSSLDENPAEQNLEKAPKPEFSRVPTIIARSMSEDLCTKTSFSSRYSLSPDSVLCSPKLRTIVSGKEIAEEESSAAIPRGSIHVEESPKQKVNRRRRGKKITSKSLSELEYEELKGFMDLGFVFSEEDKDSSLVSIIPGLQRFGKKDKEEEEEEQGLVDEPTVTRPYLSEAWEVLERRKKEEPLMNWRVPASSNMLDIKDNLRWWAHTVASTVR